MAAVYHLAAIVERVGSSHSIADGHFYTTVRVSSADGGGANVFRRIDDARVTEPLSWDAVRTTHSDRHYALVYVHDAYVRDPAVPTAAP